MAASACSSSISSLFPSQLHPPSLPPALHFAFAVGHPSPLFRHTLLSQHWQPWTSTSPPGIEKCLHTLCYVKEDRESNDYSSSRPSSEDGKGTIKGSVLRDPYPYGSSFDSGYLKVSNLHTIYYEVFGNPKGKPVVFLHGGPGSGCVPRHAGFFDPRHYKIVLFDQRGCGKSSPRGCLEENTTWDLVDDIEKLRMHLGVNKWMVMGGSWGVTLALAYSQTYPSTVSALILRGVCMLRQAEIDWFYKQGANSLFPFAWERLISVLDPSEHDMVLTAFHHRLTSNDAQRQFQAMLLQELLQPPPNANRFRNETSASIIWIALNWS